MKAPRASICALKGSVTVVPVRPIGAALLAKHNERARGEPRSGSPRARESLVGGAVLLVAVGLGLGVFAAGQPRRGRVQHSLGELPLASQQLLGELVGVPGQ